MSAALASLVEEIAALVIEKVGDKLIERAKAAAAPVEDPLLTVAEVAGILRVSPQTVRQIVMAGKLKKAPGIIETRVRKSVLDAYGK